ncbi:MAG TPA: hypothetical protein VHN37_15290 [Actinomycetota bacterium]|nr:hypothetical protein [Actinomycetota bacterium]
MSLARAGRALRSGRSRGLVRQGGWALVDQALSSGTNFAVAILVARFLGPADFGSFSYAYTAWIALMGIGRSLLVQPFQVTASALDGDEWREATKAAAGSVALLGAAAGAVIAVVAVAVGVDDPTGATLLAMAACSVPLLLQDFWRFAAFSRGDARGAAANDGLWAVVQVAAFAGVAATMELTAPVAFLAWAAGAAAGALYGMRQHRVAPAFTTATAAWARGVLGLGGWFTLSNVLYTAGVQASLVVVGVVDGRAAIGGLRSIVNLFGPAQLVRDASENVVLPRATRALATSGIAGTRKIALAYSAFVAGVMTLYGLALVVAGRWVLGGVFGTEFERFSSLMLPIAVGTVLSGSASGAAVGLRSARQGRGLASIQGILVAARVAITLALVIPFGVVGAAWGYSSVMGISSVIMWRRLFRLEHVAPGPVDAASGGRATPSAAEEPLG